MIAVTTTEIEKVAKQDLIKIGIKIKAQRNYRNLTQDELSEKSGVSKVVISRIENPNKYHNCELLSVLKLAIALEIDAVKFFDFSDLG